MKRHCVSLERHRHRWQLLVASLYTLFHLNEINTLSLYKSITYSIPILLQGIKLRSINLKNDEIDKKGQKRHKNDLDSLSQFCTSVTLRVLDPSSSLCSHFLHI